MAYTTATVILAEAEGDGRTHLDIRYTGDAGEIPIIRPFYIQSETTINTNLVRGEAMRVIAVLNQTRTIVGNIQPQLPFLLDTATPLPTPAASTFGQYMCASLPFTPGATPQDVFTISGAAGKIIRLHGAGLTTTQNTAGSNNWNLSARSSANTGGTFTNPAIVPTRAGYPAASAEVRQYTANPTAGTLVGRIWSGRVPSPVVGTALSSPGIDLTMMLERANLQLSPSVTIAFNFNGAALPAGLSVQAWFAWSEI